MYAGVRPSTPSSARPTGTGTKSAPGSVCSCSPTWPPPALSGSSSTTPAATSAAPRFAFGGLFLDPVLSSKRRQVLRFGINGVVLGLAVRFPFRPDRGYCLPVLWRAFHKQGLPGHQQKTALACWVADLVPHRDVWLVADRADGNATVLRDRPANLQGIGPRSFFDSKQ